VLVADLRAWLAVAGEERDGDATRRAVWLLDRLLPPEEAPFFGELWRRAELSASAYAFYAWGRRLGPDRRREIFELPLERRAQLAGAAQAAWCASCPPGDADSLLDWLDLVQQPGWRDGDGDTRLALDEYCGAALDDVQRERLLRLVEEANVRLARELAWPLYGSRDRALAALVRDAARSFPPPDAPFPGWRRAEHARIFDWLESELRGGGHGELAEACAASRAPNRGYGAVLHVAASFWVLRHDECSWERLIERAPGLGRRLAREVLDRASRIVPRDRLDVWVDLLERRSDLGDHPMRAFCGWLPSDDRDALLLHVDDANPDWAACAYQAYLHRCPRSVRQFRWDSWRARRRMPSWQELILDRHLHAPVEVRPGPVLHGTQEVEADIRLEDPLNHRGC